MVSIHTHLSMSRFPSEPSTPASLLSNMVPQVGLEPTHGSNLERTPYKDAMLTFTSQGHGSRYEF